MSIKRCRCFLFAIALLASWPAYADMVWPALYLETRLFSWWAIGLGLAIEFFFIRKIFSLSPKRALAADFAANAASSLLGIPLIPLAGVAWEIFPGGFFYGWLKWWGTFNPVTWAATFALACLVNVVIESCTLKLFFKLPLTKKAFCGLALANAISVGIAFCSLWWKPVHL